MSMHGNVAILLSILRNSFPVRNKKGKVCLIVINIMCILFAYVSRHPYESGYQLILANNRDEYYNRPTKPADLWAQYPQCISGLDEKPGREGGTWFGMSTQGKVAILLNILQNSFPDRNKKGRGQLASDFLVGNTSAATYVELLKQAGENYKAFNLILLEKERCADHWRTLYFSNKDPSTPRYIEEEIFGFGNSVHDQCWRKVAHGKERFSFIVNQHLASPATPSILLESLFQLLSDPTKHHPDPYIKAQGVGHVTEDLMEQYSAIHVSSQQIGTRTNSVVIIDQYGSGTYMERTMIQPIDPANPEWETHTHTFTMPSVESRK